MIQIFTLLLFFSSTNAFCQSKPKYSRDYEKKVIEYLQSKSGQEEGRRRGGLPTDDGRLLRFLISSTGAQNVLELGTGGGMSTIWLGLGVNK